jgi:hypothetical protein
MWRLIGCYKNSLILFQQKEERRAGSNVKMAPWGCLASYLFKRMRQAFWLIARQGRKILSLGNVIRIIRVIIMAA